jgi:transcriptional regulator with GAF, ATPase, and Fis domain
MTDSEPPDDEQTALSRFALAPVRSLPRIEWTEGSQRHARAIDSKTLVGSAPNVGVQLADDTVSRLHAELEPRLDGLWVRDLGSRNGTYLEGIQVTGARVPEGAKIRLGGTEITVTYERRHAAADVWGADSFGQLVGASRVMRELFSTLARIAAIDASLLIQGETGTGKELVARAVHEASPRASRPFVVVDCAALPENLLDVELFGHAKGAYTGSFGTRAGAIEAADGGTVFLDEIGELPIAVQPKLLRVLESRTVRRVGETSHRAVDVRFLSATHRDLLTMVNAGEFREDLYFRLSVVPITVPPLRERKDDIERLTNLFWRVSGGSGPVSPELLHALRQRPWRGNVRELRNFVERARALGAVEALALTHARQGAGSAPPPQRQVEAAPDSAAPLTAPGLGGENPEVFAQTYKHFREAWVDAGEREYVRRLLARHDRNVAAAAREAEVDRTYIYRLIRKHEL